MNLVRDTVRGALWTIGAGVGSRAVGLAGTLIVTRFIAPADYGEVTVAAVVVMTANQISTLGFGQYLVANPKAPRGAAFHATLFHLVLGVVAAVVVVAAGRGLGGALDAPGMIRFLPGLVVSGLLDRISYVPERVLVRDLRFDAVSYARTAGDVSHTVICVWLAAIGWGGAAIVIGNIARSAVRCLWVCAVAKRADWLELSRPSMSQTRELLAFGVPMSLGALCSFAARRWDNLLVSRFFGPSATGMYNLAYNLADVPAIQVGEQIGDVLLPSFARMDPARRPAALLRSMRLLGLVVFPLAIGLGAVAHTLVAVIFDERWHAMAPMLVLLSALSVTRPVGWTVASYLQAAQRPRVVLALEVLKLAALVAFVCTFGRISPLHTCFAVGAAFAAHTLASLWVVSHADGVSLAKSLETLVPGLAGSVPMTLAVLATRYFAPFGDLPGPAELALEVAAGGAAYVASSFVFARDTTNDLVARLLDAVRRPA